MASGNVVETQSNGLTCKVGAVLKHSWQQTTPHFAFGQENHILSKVYF
jgi:hypothetical protein